MLAVRLQKLMRQTTQRLAMKVCFQVRLIHEFRLQTTVCHALTK